MVSYGHRFDKGLTVEPKTQRAQPAPPPPTINTARVSAEQNDTMRRRQGRQSTFVSDGAGRSTGGVLRQTLGQG